MRLEKEKIVRVANYQCGIPATPAHWFRAYKGYHKETLTVRDAMPDLFPLYLKFAERQDDRISFRVNDTICAANQEFDEEEERCPRELPFTR